MATLERTRQLTADELAQLRRPRTDLVTEIPDGADAWSMAEGPFSHYRRTITVDGPETAGSSCPDGPLTSVTERTEYKMAVPFWWPYLSVVMRMALADTDRTPRRRWWWPQEVVPAQTSHLIGLLGTVGAMAGYMGVLIGQTITYASAEFGVDDTGQADTLAGVRVGVLISTILIARADTRGRRPLILWFALAAIVFTAIGSLAPSMVALGVTQTVARGLTTGLLTLIALASTEEVPAGSRAIAIAFMYLTTGFGAAAVVWVLPVSGLFIGGWRLVYLVPLLFLPILWRVWVQMPETRRFTAADAADAPGTINWWRFTLIAGTAFIAALFLSPASQLRNEFLRDDMGFSAGGISAFQLLVSIPATLAVPIGGNLADRYNRRWVGAIGLAAAAVATAGSYQASGWALWVLATIGFSSAAAAVPALRGYQVELFPTRARGRVGGLIDMVAVAGSAVGLVIVGRLSVRWDDLGSAIGVMVFAPIIVAIAILAFFPETARVELEELNPSDPDLAR